MKIPPQIPLLPGLKPSGLPVEQKNQGAVKPAETDQAKLKKTCQDFESVFLNMMLSKMRDTVPKSDVMGPTRDEDIYRGMLDEQLAKQMAASGGVGLADMMVRQLSREVPAAEQPAAPADAVGSLRKREPGEA